jgi:hypothetical protein
LIKNEWQPGTSALRTIIQMLTCILHVMIIIVIYLTCDFNVFHSAGSSPFLILKSGCVRLAARLKC